jgi:hypothetical protein
MAWINKKLSEFLPEQFKELETLQGLIGLLDDGIQPWLDNIFSKALEKIKKSQDVDSSDFPNELIKLFGFTAIIAKIDSQILPRLRSQINVLPQVFYHKGLARAVQLYLQALGLTGEIVEYPGQNKIDLLILDRYIEDSFDTAYNPGYVFKTTFNSGGTVLDDVAPIVENVKKVIPVWTKIDTVKHKGSHFLQRLKVGEDQLSFPETDFFEFFFMYNAEEFNQFDIQGTLWDVPDPPFQLQRPIIFDASIPTNHQIGERHSAGVAGSGSASWTLDRPRIIELTFSFTITDGGKVYRGKDTGLGTIVDGGSTGGALVTGGSIDYNIGSVNITVSPNFSNNVDSVNEYWYDIDFLVIS